MKHGTCRLEGPPRLLALSLFIPVAAVGLSPVTYVYSAADFHGTDENIKIERRTLTSEEIGKAANRPRVYFGDAVSIVAQTDAITVQCMPAFQISVDATAYFCFRIMNKTDSIIDIPKAEISLTRDLWWGIRTRTPIAVGFEHLYPFPERRNVTEISITPHSDSYIFLAFKNRKPTEKFVVHLTLVSDDKKSRHSFTFDGVDRL
ncbi:MAG: hypothetical protein SGI88_08485 [Candidatus Hydrogenedentes bacterium]|nr:hypothetical protein [Candidatus Hydrogenedentota bacterium]